MRVGGGDVLRKPVAVSSLTEAIRGALRRAERLSSEVSARGTVLTVAGAKGGIGKSVLAVNLAVAIRDLTRQDVALVDSDAQFGDVGIMLDLEPALSIADLARDEDAITTKSITRYLERYHTGVDVLLSRS